MPTCSLWTSLAGIAKTSAFPALGDVPFVPAPGDTPAIGKFLKKVLALRPIVRIINFVA